MMEIVNHSLVFATSKDWKPLEDACWVECPLRGLIPLGKVCRAKEQWDEYRYLICPIIFFDESKMKETRENGICYSHS